MNQLLNLIKATRRNMIKLEIGTPSSIVWGRTRFGGRPDVPADFVWPTFESDTFYDEVVRPRPLAFLAQFDCGALAFQDTDGLLPRTGILSFFYELDSARWGYDPNDAGCARVYWFDGSEPLAPADFPDELEEEFRIPRLPVQVQSAASFADWADFSMLENNPEISEGYVEAYEALGGSGNCSKLLGWPDIVQDNMTLECELVTRGYYLGDGSCRPKELAEKLARPSIDGWRLLFQLKSFTFDDFDLTFGDEGALYFYIPTQDLRAHRFDRVWTILQSE